ILKVSEWGPVGASAPPGPSPIEEPCGCIAPPGGSTLPASPSADECPPPRLGSTGLRPRRSGQCAVDLDWPARPRPRRGVSKDLAPEVPGIVPWAGHTAHARLGGIRRAP